MDEILTNLDEVARFCGCHRRTIDRYLEAGKMPQPAKKTYGAGGKKARCVWFSKDLRCLRKKIQARKKRVGR